MNECELGTHGCNGTCENLIGSYRCSCPGGYQLASDGRQCDDIDECITQKPCAGECQNLLGSFSCKCPTGFLLDPNNSRSCVGKVQTVYFVGLGDSSVAYVDIDECAQNNGGCSDFCDNKFGNFSCYCQNKEKLIDRFNCGRKMHALGWSGSLLSHQLYCSDSGWSMFDQ